MRRVLLALLLSTSLGTGLAHARSEKTLAYEREPAWQASVRFLRVDAKLKLVEKDADAGYVLFEFTEEKKTFRGSLEVIEVVKDGRKVVRFVMTIEDRPQWVEIDLLTKLERKLRAELGAPAPAPTPKDPPPPKKAEPKDPPPKNDKDDGPPVSDAP
ncbi:MAG TPA: hypothetical protein VLB44_16790 [Kofleriaceae bacterium]|nr:hypothetical protein [Kofleriaceae bacterium]